MSVCPLCGAESDARLLAQGTALRSPIIALAQESHGQWRPSDGLCPSCALRLAERLACQRSPASLQAATDPAATFPYYHPAEETVLSQPDHLADYDTFDGTGVTIAFLDSGYYPHPDLSAVRDGPQPPVAWHRLTAAQLHAWLESAGLRLVDYADLTDGGEQVGLATASLWDGAADSWHGQMTTTIAAGNGLLSGGYFRGFAPGARLLPIKIGRGGGRIPEDDIWRGLQWLLDEDRWQRYNVRVVNISIGGDFPQEWQENRVCRAAHALAQRGVLVAAAAGNRGSEELLAPAQTPTVLTVGGVDDHNRRWQPDEPAEVELLDLYHHNFGTVSWQHAPVRKPELLALGRWLAAPVLPPSPVFAETYIIDRLRRVLQEESDHRDLLFAHWQQLLHNAPPAAADSGPRAVASSAAERSVSALAEVWHALRRRMNAHKWIHPYYQHVDGTSVAVAQVSAVAAQMIQANPNLDGAEVRRLLMETSLALPHLLPRQTGAGLLQPALAVAAALRAPGGRLASYPRSATPLRPYELQKWTLHGTLSLFCPDEILDRREARPVYFGLYAPGARQVSLVGAFNRWQPELWMLTPTGGGWWHGIALLAPGAYPYRFWVADELHPAGVWQRDPENPVMVESGYTENHSQASV